MASKGWSDQQLIDAWLEYLRMNENRSTRTLEAYRLAMRRLMEFAAGESLLELLDVQLLAFTGIWLHKKSTAIYTELSIRKRTSVVDAHGPLAKITTPVSELLKRMPGARKPG